MTMPATSEAEFDAPARPEALAGLSFTIVDSLEKAEPAWRALEARATHTPYQRFDWIRAYADIFSVPGQVAILTIEADGQVIALAPFHIVGRFGVRIAQLMGMSISNGDALLIDPQFADRMTRAVLAAAFRQLPCDLVNFHAVASGRDNPLLQFRHTPSPDNLYAGELAPGDKPYIDQSLPHKRRTNIKRSRRRLVEAFGDLALRAARTPEEARAMLAVFLDQRSKRFQLMGVENVFARNEFRELFERLIIAGLAEDKPALRIHALYVGDTIVATSLGAYTPTHYSQYINSTDTGEAARYSLMGVTFSLLVEELRQNGITSLDMGLGDFDYKLDWTRKVAVYDIVIANSALGEVAGRALRAARGLKRTIKQTPQLWRAARAIQAALLKLKK